MSTTTPGPDPMTDLRFWNQVVEDQRRTVLCAPEQVHRVRGLLEAHGLADQFDVQESAHLPDGKIVMIDHNAVDAAQRAAIQQMRWAA